MSRGRYQRNSDGTFKRIRKTWSLENFDDGYIDNCGRFRVWLPDHPRAYNEGYILRSIVAYELYHDMEVFPNMDIHHKDEDRLNDSKENLEMIPHGGHSRLTNFDEEAHVIRNCEYCGKDFIIKRYRLKNPSRGKYCSQTCFHLKERTKEHKQNISDGLKKAYREGRR